MILWRSSPLPGTANSPPHPCVPASLSQNSISDDDMISRSHGCCTLVFILPFLLFSSLFSLLSSPPSLLVCGIGDRIITFWPLLIFLFLVTCALWFSFGFLLVFGALVFSLVMSYVASSRLNLFPPVLPPRLTILFSFFICVFFGGISGFVCVCVCLFLIA